MITESDSIMLEAFNGLVPDDMIACYGSPALTAAGGSLAASDAMCRDLRRRKLLVGEGRGTHAYYYISEKGRKALADFNKGT